MTAIASISVQLAAARDARCYGLPVYAEFVRPLADSLAAALKFNKSAVTAVVELVSHRGPSTIFRAVWAIVVLPLKGQADGHLSHIGAEGFKRVKPSVTDHDAAPAISAEELMIAIQASRLHRCPAPICSRLRSEMGAMNAPARPRSATCQIPFADWMSFSPAVTIAEQRGVMPHTWGQSDHQKHPKAASDQVSLKEFGHRENNTVRAKGPQEER